jgi:hypothetical protein
LDAAESPAASGGAAAAAAAPAFVSSPAAAGDPEVVALSLLLRHRGVGFAVDCSDFVTKLAKDGVLSMKQLKDFL